MKDIGTRLENWARMHSDGAAPDQADAQLLDQAMPKLSPRHRLLLWRCYVVGERPESICIQIGIAPRPAALFVEAFQAAQAALESRIAPGAIIEPLTGGIMSLPDCALTP